MAGSHRPALVTLGDAADVARELGDWRAFAQTAIDYEEVSWRPGLLGHAALKLLAEAAGHELEPELRIFVQSSLARAMFFCGDFEAAHATAGEALRQARTIGDPAVLCHALLAYSRTHPFEPPIEGEFALALALERAELAVEADVPTLDALTLSEAVLTNVNIGNIDDAKHWLDRIKVLADRKGLRFDRYFVLSLEQIFAFCEGGLARAEELAKEQLEFGNGLGEDASGTFGVQMFLIRREQGRLQELAPVVRTVLQLNPAAALWRPGLIALLCEAGMVDEARGLLEDFAAEGFAELPRDAMFCPTLCMLADVAARTGAVEIGRSLTDLLSRWGSTGVWVGPTVAFLGSVGRYVALLAALDGRTEEAEARFAQSLEYHRRLRMPVWIAHSLADQAGFYVRLNDVARARPVANEARVLAAQHGLGGIDAQLDAITVL
jgi:tetratricopeptide (TPR) repeat protein